MTSIASLSSTALTPTLSVNRSVGPAIANPPSLTLNLPAAGVSASISLEGLNALAASTRSAVQGVKHEVTQVIDGAEAGLSALGEQLGAGMNGVSDALGSAADALSDVAGYGAAAVGVTLDALA